MTNAERIRNMTDEELAKMIEQDSICDMCSAYCDAYQTPEDCVRNVIAWLKQEVSDERNAEI